MWIARVDSGYQLARGDADFGTFEAFSGIKLKEPVENAVKKAKGMQENGLMWIDYLSELLDNESLEKCLSKATLTCLQQHYHNWAAWYQE